LSGSRENYRWNANSNALLINIVYCLLFLTTKSRADFKKSRGLFENFSAK